MKNSAPNRFIWAHIFKKAPTYEGCISPLRHPPAPRKRDGRRWRAIFDFQKYGPPLWKSFRRLCKSLCGRYNGGGVDFKWRRVGKCKMHESRKIVTWMLLICVVSNIFQSSSETTKQHIIYILHKEKQLAKLDVHSIISPCNLQTVVFGKVANSGKTFPFLETCNTACLSNSASLLHISLWKLYFTW